MASLYAEGWRQGSLFTAELPLDSVVLDADGALRRHQTEHGRWVVATQDCDLDSTGTGDGSPTIELRPVFSYDTPPDWGIRSVRYCLTDADYVHGLSARTMVSAAVLSSLAPKYKYLMPLDDEMRQRIRPLAKPYPRASRLESEASGVQPEDEGAAMRPTRSTNPVSHG